MSLTHDTSKLAMGVVLLAPVTYEIGPFRHRADRSSHDRLLANAQRLRGDIYFRDGAISPTALTDDGRYVQRADDESWHLLIIDTEEKLQGCVRYCVHPSDVLFADLHASHCSMLQSEPWGSSVRRAIQSDIDRARLLGFSYIEVGGWAISEKIRCTTEVLRMVLMIYAFGQLMGGAYGLSNVTTRHHSASILRRLGGASLIDKGKDVPPYHDPDYGCQMEFLTFDSTKPNPRYAGWIDDCHYVLSNLVAITPGCEDIQAGSLLQLNHAISENASHGLEDEPSLSGPETVKTSSN